MIEPRAGALKLRNLDTVTIEGATAEALATNLNAYFETAGEKTLVLMMRVADLKVLLVYAE